MFNKLIFMAYAVILCVGGFFGWKAGSPISLVTSGISAALVGLGVFLLKDHARVGYSIVAIVGALLTVTFVVRLVQTHKIMPAVPMLVISLPICLLCLYRIIKHAPCQ
jgi:uncharacterized membrane protein (UPF0136 family)